MGPRRVVHVGTGGFGAVWCERFLAPSIEAGLIDVVAAADVNPAALENARRHLGLPRSRCHHDAGEAFAAHEADFCTIVVPPWRHEEVVDEALRHGLHILSEKPIADSLEAGRRVAEKVAEAGVRMAITMSHRFDQDKWTLRTALRSGRHGRLDYLVLRFTTDCRAFGAWSDTSPFRYEMPDPLLIEAGVHHLDLLADLAGAECATVSADTWNPEWGAFAGDSQALVSMRFENGVRALYEGATSNAVGLNGWAREYIRAECELGTLVLSSRRLEAFPHDARATWAEHAEGTGTEIPLLERGTWTHRWLLEQFVDWLDGGPAPATAIESNLRSLAAVFAAVESSRRGGVPVEIRDVLEGERIP